jgi:predicted metalloprotease
MRWKGRRQSDNIEDRRGVSGRTAVAGGGGLALIIALVVMLLGGDPSAVLGAVQPGAIGAESAPIDPAQEPLREFTAVTLADTEEVWSEVFLEEGLGDYPEPKLVIFTGQVESACGFQSSAVGPFYCPGDDSVYIDLSFYQTLKDQLGARGDFAQAYVIAHEVGHHVQKVLGVSDEMARLRQRLSEREMNQMSVRQELQADFYAGFWAQRAAGMAGIDEEDIREAIEAAGAIGDDTLQQRSQGHVVPDSFTHGSSEQRIRWFLKGWRADSIKEGDTFSARSL